MEFKKKGTLFIPTTPVLLEFTSTIDQPMKPITGKMYLFLNTGDVSRNRVHEIHTLSNTYLQKGRLINPLQGHVLKVKVPYKYDKVTCKVLGNKALQELVKGDVVTVVVEYCGVWDVNGYCGPSWKLSSLETCQ